jgi:hypothetical protein
MWICLNDGFVSVVADPEIPGNLLVRARSAKHLKALAPEVRITKTPKRDYGWRVSLPADIVASIIANRVVEIDYDNFKDSVKERKLHRMYEMWWGDHFRYQRGNHAF